MSRDPAFERWIAYGQTHLCKGQYVDNPGANLAGVTGERSLPFHVPAGKALIIRSQGIEGNDLPMSGLFVYLGPAAGDATDINDRSLPTVGSGYGSGQFTGLDWEIRGPATVNVRIMNASPHGRVHGWYVAGDLRDVGR